MYIKLLCDPNWEHTDLFISCDNKQFTRYKHVPKRLLLVQCYNQAENYKNMTRGCHKLTLSFKISRGGFIFTFFFNLSSVKHTSKMSWIKATSIHPLTSASNSFFFFLAMFSGAPTPVRLPRWKGCCTTRLSRGLDTCSEAAMSLTQLANRRLWAGLEKTKKEWGHAWSPWWKIETGLPSAYTYTVQGLGGIECPLDEHTEEGPSRPGGHI